MAFIDRVEVKLQAGKGGDGALSFHHEKFRAKGGPDGGDGGNGGDIVLIASRNQNTLAAFRYKKLLKAEDGQPGRNSKKHGKKGADLEVPVPVGTVVTKDKSEVMADMTEDGQRFVVAKGGRGGFGNAHFTSSSRQTPRVVEKGESGQTIQATFELKLIADVGIVGLPNAGKSTLLSVLSNAKPEIADYPFTTLEPHLGVVDIDNQHSLLFADIPGLIEGASQGKGLGDEFLRHVERTSVLLHLIDAYSEDIVSDYQTIIKELADYKVDLSRLPQLIALTKIEGLAEKQLTQQINKLKKAATKGTTVMAISSHSHSGLDELKRQVYKLVEKAMAKQDKADKSTELPVIGLKEEDDWRIQKTDKGFIVTGSKIERFAQRTHFGDYFGEQRLRDIMARLGIWQELERQGAEAGQVVIIGQPPIGQLDI